MNDVQPLLFVKQASWPFQAQRSSCLKVRVKVIWAGSGGLASGKASARLSGYSVQCLAGCRSNMDAVAASVLRPRGRLVWEHNPDEEWGASSPSRRSSASPEGLVLVVCWVHLLTLL